MITETVLRFMMGEFKSTNSEQYSELKMSIMTVNKETRMLIQFFWLIDMCGLGIGSLLYFNIKERK